VKRFNKRRQLTDYFARKTGCAACPLRSQCTRYKLGRTIVRHLSQEVIDRGRLQVSSAQGRQDRRRRRHLGEGSFADASRHHFKRARWRRLKRQRIQDLLIVSIQNMKIIVRSLGNGPRATETSAFAGFLALLRHPSILKCHLKGELKRIRDLYLYSITGSFPAFSHS
jgi:hypothetical protein